MTILFETKFLPPVREKIMAVSDKINNFSLSKFNLGNFAPKLDKVQVMSMPGGVAKCRCWGEYKSDMAVVFELDTKIGKFSFGIKDFTMEGDMVFILNPYEEGSTGTGSVSVYFIQLPEIHFSFAGTTTFINQIGVKGVMMDVLNKALEQKMVLPNMMSINIGLAEFKIYPLVVEQPEPLGILHVKLLKGSLVKQEKRASLKHVFENAFEFVDNKLGHLMGKDMSEYFHLRLGQAIWEPKVSGVQNQSFDFVVVDPQQQLFLSVWDRDVMGGDDEMAHVGPFYLNQLQHISGPSKPLHFIDGDRHDYAIGDFEFEWSACHRGALGPTRSLLLMSMRELLVNSALEKTRKLVIRGKLGSEEKTSNMGSVMKDKLELKTVKAALEDVKEVLQKANVNASIVEQVMNMKPKVSRVSLNSAIYFPFLSSDVNTQVLELQLIEMKKEGKKWVEHFIDKTNINLLDLKNAAGMMIENKINFKGSLGKVEAEINLVLCSLTPTGFP